MDIGVLRTSINACSLRIWIGGQMLPLLLWPGQGIGERRGPAMPIKLSLRWGAVA